MLRIEEMVLGFPMSSRKRARRDSVYALVAERGTISVGALADLLDVCLLYTSDAADE